MGRGGPGVTEIPVHECQVSLCCGPAPTSVGLYSTQHWKLRSLDPSAAANAWHVDIYANWSHTCEDVLITVVPLCAKCGVRHNFRAFNLQNFPGGTYPHTPLASLHMHTNRSIIGVMRFSYNERAVPCQTADFGTICSKLCSCE